MTYDEGNRACLASAVGMFLIFTYSDGNDLCVVVFSIQQWQTEDQPVVEVGLGVDGVVGAAGGGDEGEEGEGSQKIKR